MYQIQNKSASSREIPPQLAEALAAARRLSLAAQGAGLEIFIPGMFTAYGRKGRYPALSITGPECVQQCDHCAGKLLETMPPATSGEELLALGRRLHQQGQVGFLLSGGTDGAGRLPWERVLPAISQLSDETDLFISAHVGRVDADLARRLKAAGVRQALVDVVGDEDTARTVLHLADGLAAQTETLAACAQAGLELVPHIILGLAGGRWQGEEQALATVAALNPKRVVFVVLMPLKGTPLAGATPPPVEEVARFLARARQRLPQARHHLGCARPRGEYRSRLDALAVAAGINALALPSGGALRAAAELGIDITYHDTCCSLAGALENQA